MGRTFSVARSTIFTGLFGLALLASACKEAASTENCGGPNDYSTRQDGQCCTFSVNCQPGSICNDTAEDFYDATKTELTCIKVVCASDSDCAAPKTCGLEKVCNAPVCQSDGECSPGSICKSGECKAPDSGTDAASCTIVTRDTSLNQGGTLTLEAVAKNANGKVLTGIEFTWTSQNMGVASIAGAVATGGAMEGTSAITAAVSAKPAVTCSGLTLTNFPDVSMGSTRVVVVNDDNGAPVVGATVTVFDSAGALQMGTTNTNGAATVTIGMPASVTVEAANHQTVSIIAPETNSIFLPLPRIPDNTRAGGFKGKIDLSSTRKADIQLGIAGPAIPSNLLDFGLETLLGDAVNTVIDAPELGLTNEMVDLPGGIMLGLGNKRFTADSTRCQGTLPGDKELGCFLARAPEGPSAGWVLAGQLRLSQVTSIANQLGNALGGGGGGDLPIGDILTAVLPLLRSLNHGVNAALTIQEFGKVSDTAGTDCTDPNLANYDNLCHGDYTKYQTADMTASQKLAVLSRVQAPNLPMLPGGSTCAGAAVLLTGAVLPGRGIIPLGLSAGLDKVKAAAADCKIEGVDKPFGENSPKLSDGEMPLSMAPPHSGIEGSSLAMVLIALDPNSVADNLQLNAIVKHVSRVGDTENLSGQPYLPYPQGTLTKASASFTFSSAVAGATATRLEIQNGGATWLVYSKGDLTSIQLPNVMSARNVLNGNGLYVQALKISGSYQDLWKLGSGKNLNALIGNMEAFVVQQCGTAATDACKLQ